MLGKLIVSIKDKLARSLQEPDLALAFRQIERWASDSSNFVPTGVIVPYIGTLSVGTDYLLCDGLSYLRSSFPELAALIGGVGNTFTVPNLIGPQRFLRGGAPGATGGSTTSPHSHPLSDAGQADIFLVAGNPQMIMRRVASSFTANLQATGLVVSAGSGAQTDGAGLAGNTDSSSPSNLPPYYQTNFLIKT